MAEEFDVFAQSMKPARPAGGNPTASGNGNAAPAGNGTPSGQQKGGIALRNVNSRIRLMFGENYGLRIFSAEGIGTECCVTLPLLFQEE